jgi:HK97 family phage portal protein
VPNFLSRVLASVIGKASEGQPRPGPWQLPITGGWLPVGVGDYANWWQMGYDPIGIGSPSAMVEACVSAYAQTIAMCPGDHWVLNDDGGRERVTNSALSRILRRPNSYQSISDFLLNATRNLYLDGNAYALALRNSRYEISELHLMDSRLCWPQLAVTGDIFYHLAGNDIIEKRFSGEKLVVPQRDVLHIRLHSTSHKAPYPLRGETPLMAAMTDMSMSAAISKQQIDFYRNQARPSAVLSTELVMSKDQRDQLRDQWNEQVKGMQQGGTPILTAGLKVVPWTTPGRDAQLAEMMRMSEEHIALAFRVPLQVLGMGRSSSGSNTYGSTEMLMQAWIASGLGFALNHIEEAFGLTFDLWGQPDEYVEFDTAALLRSAMKDRYEALTKAVQGGILAPNEARALEGYDEVKFGDEPRVQQQVVPLSAAAGIPAPRPSAAPAPPAPQIPSAPKQVQNHVRSLISAADKFDRNVA